MRKSDAARPKAARRKRSDKGPVVTGEEGVDQAKAEAIHRGMIEAITTQLPANGMTVLSAALHMAVEVALMVGVSGDDTTRMMGEIYNGSLHKLRQALSTADYGALIQKIASQRLFRGAANDAQIR